MIGGTLVIMLFGFLGVIGAIFWPEHRQTRAMNARMDGFKTDFQKDVAELKDDLQRDLDGFKTDFQKDMAELKVELRAQDERHRALEGKVDRIQGSLDVLIYAYHLGATDRPAEERQMSETTAD